MDIGPGFIGLLVQLVLFFVKCCYWFIIVMGLLSPGIMIYMCFTGQAQFSDIFSIVILILVLALLLLIPSKLLAFIDSFHLQFVINFVIGIGLNYLCYSFTPLSAAFGSEIDYAQTYLNMRDLSTAFNSVVSNSYSVSPATLLAMFGARFFKNQV